MEDQQTTIKSNEENLELYSDEYPFKLPLRIKNFHDDSEYKKFVKTVERMVRTCPEYKEWRTYIVDALGIDKCMITNESMDEVTVEVHHHIPSLYALVSAVLNKYIDKEQEFCSMDICNEIIKLHYQNKIGYVTLLKSMHEKFHNGFLRVPIDLVRGDYKYILENYMQYFDDDDVDKINFRLAVESSNCNWSKNSYMEDNSIKKTEISDSTDQSKNVILYNKETNNLKDLIGAS